MSEINKELLAKVRDKILAEPDSYNQEVFAQSLAPCQTACCIAGHALIISGRRTVEEVLHCYEEDYPEYINAGLEAAIELGLEGPMAMDVLFTAYPDLNWPSPFRGMWRNAETSSERAEVAAAFINHIIETGKVTE